MSQMNIPSILKDTVRDARVENMKTLGGFLPTFHPYGWPFDKFLIDLRRGDGEIIIERYAYHVEVTCAPKNGVPRLFKMVVNALRDAGMSVDALVYTRATDLIEVNI